MPGFDDLHPYSDAPTAGTTTTDGRGSVGRGSVGRTRGDILYKTVVLQVGMLYGEVDTW